MAELAERTRPADSTFVRVTVGAESYALPVQAVLEVSDLGELTAVPGAPPSVLGLCNLRGNVLPVLDLGRLLGSGAEPARRMVVVERGGKRAGLAVVAVTDVGALPEACEPDGSKHVSAAAVVDGQLVGFVDLDSVLAAVAGGPL